MHWKSTLQIRSFDDPTNSREVPIDIGSVVSISCRDDSDKVFLKFSSFLVPGTVYQLDLEKAQALAWRSSGEEIPGFKVRQEWATSKDGTRVPMFVIGGSNEFGLIYGEANHLNVVPILKGLRIWRIWSCNVTDVQSYLAYDPKTH